MEPPREENNPAPFHWLGYTLVWLTDLCYTSVKSRNTARSSLCCLYSWDVHLLPAKAEDTGAAEIRMSTIPGRWGRRRERTRAAMLEAGYSQHVLFSFQRVGPWCEGESDNAAAESKLAFSLGCE